MLVTLADHLLETILESPHIMIYFYREKFSR